MTSIILYITTPQQKEPTMNSNGPMLRMKKVRQQQNRQHRVVLQQLLQRVQGRQSVDAAEPVFEWLRAGAAVAQQQ